MDFVYNVCEAGVNVMLFIVPGLCAKITAMFDDVRPLLDSLKGVVPQDDYYRYIGSLASGMIAQMWRML